jgi:hypothetical protein
MAREQHLSHMPFIPQASGAGAAAHAPRLDRPCAPLPPGCVGDPHTTNQEERFDGPLAEAEAVGQRHPMATARGGKPLGCVTLGGGGRRQAFSPALSAYTRDHLAYIAGG